MADCGEYLNPRENNRFKLFRIGPEFGLKKYSANFRYWNMLNSFCGQICKIFCGEITNVLIDEAGKSCHPENCLHSTIFTKGTGIACPLKTFGQQQSRPNAMCSKYRSWPNPPSHGCHIKPRQFYLALQSISSLYFVYVFPSKLHHICVFRKTLQSNVLKSCRDVKQSTVQSIEMWKVSGFSRFERRLLGLKGRSWSTCPARPYSDISHGKYCEYSGQSRPRCPTSASFEWTLLNMNLRRSNFILWCCIECVDVEVAWVCFWKEHRVWVAHEAGTPCLWSIWYDEAVSW